VQLSTPQVHMPYDKFSIERNGIVILVLSHECYEGVKSSLGSSTPQIELPVSKLRNAVID